MQRTNESYLEAFKIAVTYLAPCNAIKLSVALNYTIFLAELKREKQKALKLLEIIEELALTCIDDSVSPDTEFTQEEKDLLDDIATNIELWKSELDVEKN